MVEIFWKSDGVPSQNQHKEYVQLRLLTLGVSRTPHYLVREIRAAWSPSAGSMNKYAYQDDECRTSEEAKKHFAARKAAIVASGFKPSTC